MSPAELNRFKIDNAFAARKLQEIKDAELAKQMENDNADIKIQELETMAPATPSSIDSDSDASIFKWPHEAILLLIEEYRKRETDFSSGKISQKKIWQAISAEVAKSGKNITGPQCMSKFTGLKRTYKAVKDHNGKSGNSTRAWPYYEKMDGLLGTKPYIEPVATISSTGKRSRSDSATSSDSSPAESTSKRSNAQVSNRDFLLAIQESKKLAETNREQRHREIMRQRNESLELLKQILSSLNK